MRYQEQKHGGKEQVTVQTKDGNKYLLLWIVHNPDVPHGRFFQRSASRR